MTQPDTLHTTRLRDEIERRLAVARAATPGPWSRYGNLGYAVITEAPGDDLYYESPAITRGSDREADAEYIALHDPADAIRRYEGELDVLERHAPCACDLAAEFPHCRTHRCLANEGHRCPEIRSLAHRLGMSVDDGGVSVDG